MPVAALAAAIGAGQGCGGPAGGACTSTRDFFVREVWTKTMGVKCIQCHMADGIAVAEGHARFVLQPPSYPGFIDANLAMARNFAAIQVGGRAELLLKPLGQLAHGGGAQIADGGAEARALEELVARFERADDCVDTPRDVLANVVLLDPRATLRKATIDLADRLPTAEEESAVAAGGEAALDAALDRIMREPAFFARIRDVFGDALSTPRLDTPNEAPALFGLDYQRDYPWAQPYADGNGARYGDPKTWHINSALAQEPLRLIAHVVEEERPFTEVLTADYTVVNPYSAIAYGLDGQLSFKSAVDDEEWTVAHVAQADTGPLPHAGVLTTPSFLIRWSSTTSNVNRGRARRVLQFFLGTDIQALVQRSASVSKFDRTENPTRNAQACTVCHATIDPIAGAFRGYSDGRFYARFDPTDPWHDEMFAPGFGGRQMPGEDDAKGLQWLAREVAADPRFPLAIVKTVYAGLTGRKPLALPAGGADATAWQAQDALFRAISEDFVKSSFNLKSVVKALVRSPHYRGAGLTHAVSAAEEAAYADVGIGQLLSPEALDRKITAITGFHWRQVWYMQDPVTGQNLYTDTLRGNYYTAYGGVDYFSIVDRVPVPNGIMSNIASRMANEVTCGTVNWEFGRPASARRLFPKVELDEVPEVNGAPVPSAVRDIRANIQHLHKIILGEDLAVDDPEIDRTYSLFLSTWREWSAEASTDVPCSPYPPTGEIEPWPPVQHDTTHTLRAWMAVESYLLSDWKFLYQ